jgi:hypothetical protein
MSTAPAVAVAVAFVWLGMVLAISFVETPLKFRAPDVTLRIGLGIGRLVFRALNTVELVLAVALVVSLVLADGVSTGAVVATACAVVALMAQVAAVRPALSHRTARVLAGEDAPRSHAHLAYVGLEVVKVVALVVAGVLLLRG